MKKIYFALLSLLLISSYGCKQKQESDKVAALASPVPEGQVISTEDLSKQWTDMDIPVAKKGQLPDIIEFIQAFHKIWPTQVVTDFLVEANEPGFTESVNPDLGSRMLAYRDRGYAELSAGDSDDDCMEASVLKCANGHLLFFFNMVSRTPDHRNIPLHQALCCYDYNPETGVMSPVQNDITKFQPQLDNTALVYELDGFGSIMRIGEEDKAYENETVWHFFEFDGNAFKMYDTCTDLELEHKVSGTWVNFDPNYPAITFALTKDDESGGLTASDCGIYGSTEYEPYVSVWNGAVSVDEMIDEEEGEAVEADPAFKSTFIRNSKGELVGFFALRQNGGATSKGCVTLKQGNPEDALKQ